MKTKSFIAVFAGVLTIGSFAQAQAHGGTTSVGPAATRENINCVELGGALESMQNLKGEYMNCVIKENDLLAKMADKGLSRVSMSDLGAASSNCLNSNGVLKYEFELGVKSAKCIIEATELLNVVSVVP